MMLTLLGATGNICWKFLFVGWPLCYWLECTLTFRSFEFNFFFSSFSWSHSTLW